MGTLNDNAELLQSLVMTKPAVQDDLKPASSVTLKKTRVDLFKFVTSKLNTRLPGHVVDVFRLVHPFVENLGLEVIVRWRWANLILERLAPVRKHVVIRRGVRFYLVPGDSKLRDADVVSITVVSGSIAVIDQSLTLLEHTTWGVSRNLHLYGYDAGWPSTRLNLLDSKHGYLQLFDKGRSSVVVQYPRESYVFPRRRLTANEQRLANLFEKRPRKETHPVARQGRVLSWQDDEGQTFWNLLN